MIDLLLQEPIQRFIEQWPFVVMLAGILWIMRRDLLTLLQWYRDCMEQRAALDREQKTED